MANIQRYINAGFTKTQAQLIVDDFKNQEKQIKELKGEILYLEAIVFHRQDLIKIT
jgi:hypothetical protein